MLEIKGFVRVVDSKLFVEDNFDDDDLLLVDCHSYFHAEIRLDYPETVKLIKHLQDAVIQRERKVQEDWKRRHAD